MIYLSSDLGLKQMYVFEKTGGGGVFLIQYKELPQKCQSFRNHGTPFRQYVYSLNDS